MATLPAQHDEDPEATGPHGGGGGLRRGWTTGACATAAAKAAYEALLTGAFPDPVTIRLPRGLQARFPLAERELSADGASAGVIKDAGDDPDVTHGATVRATVRPGAPGSGIVYAAGEGVGTVTLPGLPIPPGEPAINPRPREMIAAALREVAAACDGPEGTDPDLVVTIAIPGGAELAARTANPRLGIVGGLSVLGTTGVVIPYSCASWVHSIHRGIDVARANGVDHIAAATGRTSEEAARLRYGLGEQALIDMGDFAGATLKYLRTHPLPRLTLAGGFGKLSKLAAGEMDLHSSRSSVDTGDLAARLLRLGGDGDLAGAVRAAPSAGAALDLARAAGLDGALAADIAGAVRTVARAALAGDTDVDVMVVTRDGRVIADAGP